MPTSKELLEALHRMSKPVLILALGVIALALGCMALTISLWADEPAPPPAATKASESAPPLDATPANPNRYVVEVVDSLFRVEPAEFLALDLPTSTPGARAIHLLGTVNVTDRKGDIIVRLFRAPEYQNWLKKRGGEKGNAFWSSRRSRALTLDQDLPQDVPIVLLIDNGYSVRTPKTVRTQLQIQYERNGVAVTRASGAPGTSGTASEDDIITPRANTEEETPPPPPPPPPPDEGGE
jgi:hypothetical protein